jgi:hypothetical protein
MALFGRLCDGGARMPVDRRSAKGDNRLPIDRVRCIRKTVRWLTSRSRTTALFS